MRYTLQRQWWMPLIRGIFAIIFGALALIYPGLTLTALIYVFAAYAIADGGITLYQALSGRDGNRHWGWGIAEGLVSLIAGIGALIAPWIAGLTLLFIIGFWAIFTGIAQIVMAFRMRAEIENEFWLGLAGVASVIFGGFVVFDPLGGALATAWLIGIYSLLFGAALIALSLRLRSLEHDGPETQTMRASDGPLSSNA